MPVFVQGVPQYKILPPVTCGDHGEPTESIEKDAQRVFDLIQDERHLLAERLLLTVETRLSTFLTEKANASASKAKHQGLGIGFGARKKAEETNARYQRVTDLLKKNENKIHILRVSQTYAASALFLVLEKLSGFSHCDPI